MSRESLLTCFRPKEVSRVSYTAREGYSELTLWLSFYFIFDRQT